MAIGLSYMLGIKLPVNFNSPYKAINIIDFWRRWHMSLSRFFRDYLYIPLGGGRRGAFRKYLNLFIVMVIVGFWHGAGWTFILWGTYHGSLLILNHGWHAFKNKLSESFHFKINSKVTSQILRYTSIAFTFFLVVLGWVLFRADNFGTVENFYKGMFHIHHHFFGTAGLLTLLNYIFFGLFLLASLAICAILPNTIEIMKSTNAILDNPIKENGGSAPGAITNKLLWTPNIWYGFSLGILAYFSITTISQTPSTFLYFNF